MLHFSQLRIVGQHRALSKGWFKVPEHFIGAAEPERSDWSRTRL